MQPLVMALEAAMVMAMVSLRSWEWGMMMARGLWGDGAWWRGIGALCGVRVAQEEEASKKIICFRAGGAVRCTFETGWCIAGASGTSLCGLQVILVRGQRAYGGDWFRRGFGGVKERVAVDVSPR